MCSGRACHAESFSCPRFNAIVLSPHCKRVTKPETWSRLQPTALKTCQNCCALCWFVSPVVAAGLVLQQAMCASPDDIAQHSKLLNMLEDRNADVRFAALEALEKLPTNHLAKYSPQIMKLLKDSEWMVSSAALETFKRLPADLLGEQSIALLKLVDEPSADVRSAAVEAISKLPAECLAEHSLKILEMLKDTDWTIRFRVLQCSSKLPAHRLPEYCLEIVKLLKDSQYRVRCAALETLREIPADCLVTHSSEVLQMLDNPCESDRFTALKALALLHPNHLSEHCSKLVNMLRVQSCDVRCAALETLRKVLPDHLAKHASELLIMLKDSSDSVRARAVKTLEGLPQEKLAEHSSQLLTMLEDPSLDVCQAACDTLGKLSPVDFARLELPGKKDTCSNSPHLSELREMHQDSIRVTNLVVEVCCGILMLSSNTETNTKMKQAQIVDIKEEIASNRCPALQKDTVPCGSVFKLTPEGVSFQEPVRLLVPVGCGDMALRSTNDGWEEVPAFFGSSYVEVTLDHFCYFVIVAQVLGCQSFLCQWIPRLWASRSVPRVALPLPVPSTVSTVSTAHDESRRIHLFMSARFNRPERMTYLRSVKEALARRSVPVYMVDVGPGESFAMPTMAGLFRTKMMAAFCTEDYGEETGARYETFHELRYAWEKNLRIVPVRLCTQYPPTPHGDAGKMQNDFVFSNTLLYIDGIAKSAEKVAQELAEVWHRYSWFKAMTIGTRSFEAHWSTLKHIEAKGLCFYDLFCISML